MKKALTSSSTNALLIFSGTPMVAEPIVHPKVRTRRICSTALARNHAKRRNSTHHTRLRFRGHQAKH